MSETAALVLALAAIAVAIGAAGRPARRAIPATIIPRDERPLVEWAASEDGANFFFV